MAVYTHVEVDAVQQVLDRFKAGRLHSIRGIAEGVENSNFLIETDQARFILTLYEKRVDPDDLPFFLGLMEHLASAGVACPLPLRDGDGAALFELARRPGAIITYLDGVSVDAPTPRQCKQVGAALAGLHAAQTGFTGQRPNALSLTGWRELTDKTQARANEVEAGLAEVIAAEMAHLAAHWPKRGSLPEGVIHADLFPDNVFFLEGTLSGLIDFYFACRDMLAYDLAICINAWCFDDQHRYLPGHAAALLAGYESVRALNGDERANLPILARGAALRFALTRLYDWLNPAPGALVRPKDPRDYVKRLAFFQTHPDLSA